MGHENDLDHHSCSENRDYFVGFFHERMVLCLRRWVSKQVSELFNRGLYLWPYVLFVGSKGETESFSRITDLVKAQNDPENKIKKIKISNSG